MRPIEDSSRARRRAGAAGILTTLLALAAGAPADGAAIQSLQVQAAPNAQAGRPELITATGTISPASTVAIYAQAGGLPCAAQAAAEAARGAALVDSRTVSGPLAYSVSFTPTAPGTYFICTYVDGSSPGTLSHQNQAFTISVAPAPSPPPAAGPAPTPALTAPGRPCVVPALKRHTLGRVRHLLALANCKLGTVYAPSARAQRAARRRNHGHARSLVVVSQTPVAGSVRVAGFTVAVRLSFGSVPPAKR